jgi:phosphate transport system substrate-binding protein
MPLAEIEIYEPMILLNPSTQRDAGVTNNGKRKQPTPRWCAVFALACLVLLGPGQPAGAAQQGLPLFADRDLGEALAQAVQNLGPNAQHIDIKPSAIAAACAAAPGTAPRLALLARNPTRAELDRCGQTASAEVTIVEIGRQAVAVVVPINSPVWSVNTAGLFRALGQNSGNTSRTTTWNEIDPSYPKLPIGLLLPPTNSRTWELFNALIMQSGCDRTATARMPFDLKSRAAYCAALRTDIQVSAREGGVQGIASWAAAALPGQIAIVSVAELRQLDHRVVPLLLDGALPTAANIDSGRYPAAEKIELMIVVPTGANRTQRADARTLAFNLLAETSIGPTGSLAPAGLIPLPPPDRIAARSQAITFLEPR